MVAKVVHPMAFFHAGGLVPSWRFAQHYAGKGGHLATMPDIIDARLNSNPGDAPWESYFTTISSEFFGLSRQGHPILIVAHGIGPMATLDGALAAYSYHFNDKSRDNRGGRITLQQFRDLEDGQYGDVAIVDLKQYVKGQQYPFMGRLTVRECLGDALLLARLGPKAEEYIHKHGHAAQAWHREQAGTVPEEKYGLKNTDQYILYRLERHLRGAADVTHPYIMSVEGSNRCSYGYRDPRTLEFVTLLERRGGGPFAHLLSIGSLAHVNHDGNESLMCDISCHDWTNGVRMVGIPQGASLNTIRRGPDPYNLLRQHWPELMRPSKATSIGLRPLVQLGDEWFTQYPKKGAGMDTHDAEFHVTAMKPIGEPVLFTTPVLGYYGLFKYDIRDVATLAPSGANAYAFVSEAQLGPGAETQSAMIQFYWIEADLNQRLRTADQIAQNYDLMMRLSTSNQAA